MKRGSLGRGAKLSDRKLIGRAWAFVVPHGLVRVTVFPSQVGVVHHDSAVTRPDAVTKTISASVLPLPGSTSLQPWADARGLRA